MMPAVFQAAAFSGRWNVFSRFEPGFATDFAAADWLAAELQLLLIGWCGLPSLSDVLGLRALYFHAAMRRAAITPEAAF